MGTHGRSAGHSPRLARPPRSASPPCLPAAGTMVDRGPLLTSAIIFYLSIGAAIFEVLEEPHWRSATDNYKRQKTELLKQFPCLGQEGLDKILQVQRAPPELGPGLGGASGGSSSSRCCRAPWSGKLRARGRAG